MSYEVPHAPTPPRPWNGPHWYSVLSLIFHSIIIGRGVHIYYEHPSVKWSYGEWTFRISIVIAFFSLISVIRRNKSTTVLVLNTFSNFILIGAFISGFEHILFSEDYYLFHNIIFLIPPWIIFHLIYPFVSLNRFMDY